MTTSNKVKLYIYIYNIHIYHIYIHIYTNLAVNAIVRLPHSRSGDSQGQETFLAPSVNKQTRSYSTRILKPPSLPIPPYPSIHIYDSNNIKIDKRFLYVIFSKMN